MTSIETRRGKRNFAIGSGKPGPAFAVDFLGAPLWEAIRANIATMSPHLTPRWFYDPMGRYQRY